MIDIQALHKAEAVFLDRYPGGFDHPEMVAIGKKHKMKPMIAFAKAQFNKSSFDHPNAILDSAIKIMSRSSMISMFEKPKFKDFVAHLAHDERLQYVNALYDVLHGKKKQGFSDMVDVLGQYKIAKWSIATAIPAYYRPNADVFVKPTTTKLVINKLGLDLDYHPRPTWEFYSAYKKIVAELKSNVTKDLSPSNAAFLGFLMMTLEEI